MIQIIITLQDDKQVKVEGPIYDKLFCYGIIELAKETISKYNPKIKPVEGIIKQ